MIKTKKQGSKVSQSQYLKDQIVHYYLLEAIVLAPKPAKSSVKIKVNPPKPTHRASKPTKDLESFEDLPEPNYPDTDLEKPKSQSYVDVKNDKVIDKDLEDIKKVLGLTPKVPYSQEVEESRSEQHKKRSFSYKKWAIACVGLVLLVVLVQLLYPKDRTLPFARLQSAGYQGFANKQEVLGSFDNFNDRIVTIHTHTKALTTSYKDLGVTIDPNQTTNHMTEYDLKSRLIPFSILFKGNKTYYVDRSIDESRLGLYVKDVVAQASKQPVDAVVSKNGTLLSTTESEDGYRYETEALRTQILRSDLSNKGQIIFAPTVLRPSLSSQTAKEAINKMQKRINTSLTINADGKSYVAGPEVIASWVTIKLLPEQQNIDIGLDKQAIAGTLGVFFSQVDKNQVPNKVTLLNGALAGRIEGSSGRKIDRDNLIKQVSEASNPSVTSLEANVATIPQTEVTERRYTKDNQGLQSMMGYWTSTHRGEYSIDIRSIDDRISANYNGFRILPAAGFNKIFVAALVYGKISTGSSSLQTTVGGQSVETCLNKMIQAGDNNCTNLLGDLVGWSAGDSSLKDQGLSSTTLSLSSSLTSATDNSVFLQKIYNGSVISRSYSSSLLSKMQNSAGRSGIPAGSNGASVASMSGSFGRIKNDSGLVYAPSNKYIISVMSDGANANDISDLASEAYKIFAQ